MFTFSKEIKKNGLIEEALPVIRGRASAFGESLRFQKNVIGGDEPAVSPYTVTCDLRNISIWVKIRRKRVRISIEVSLCGGHFLLCPRPPICKPALSKRQQRRVPFRENFCWNRVSRKITFGELRSLAMSNLFFK